MADRFKNLSDREQRIEMMRRNGEDFRDERGDWVIALGVGEASALVRALWDDDPDAEADELEASCLIASQLRNADA